MIKSLSSTLKAGLLGVAVGAGLLLASTGASAQQSMTVEELENFILKKKSELSATVDERDSTLDKRAELDRKRTEQATRQRDIEQELRKLCKERDDAEPGSLDSCLSELNIVDIQ